MTDAQRSRNVVPRRTWYGRHGPIGNTPDAPARLAAWAGSLVRTRSRGDLTVGPAAYLAIIWRLASYAAIPLLGIWLATHLVPQAPVIDDLAYWGTRDGVLYELTWNTRPDSYVYSPAFAQAIAPFAALPYMTFHVGLSIVQLAVVVWLLGPLGALGFCLVPFLGGSYIWNGNITPLIAFALVKGQHWPALLTKILPGVTIAWFVGARDWRGLRRQLAILGGIVVVSFVLWPGAWVDWVDALTRAQSSALKGWAIPLWLRFPVAAAIAVYAGHSGRRWLLPIAAMLSTADVWWSSAVWLIAVPRMLRPASSRVPSTQASRRAVTVAS